MNNHLFCIPHKKQLILLAISQFIYTILFSQGLLETLLQNLHHINYVKTERTRFFLEADTAFATHFYTLIPSHKNLYAWVDGTGRLYKATQTDTGITFVRQDSTTHFGYNIAAFPFSYKGRIYTMGGYGLWRINGQLRVYNEQDRQWDISKLNEEIPFIFDGDNNLLWYNPTGSSIYLSCAWYRNEAVRQNKGVIDETKYDYTVRRLNLQKMQWEKLGELNKILRNKNISTIAMSPWGQLILVGDKINLIDFVRNRVLVFDVNNPSYQSIVRNRYDYTFYFKDSTLYYGSIKSMKFDSTKMKYADFNPTEESVYSTQNNQTLIIILGVVGALAFSVFLIRSLSKKYSFILINKKNVQFSGKAISPRSFNFDEKELQLLGLLVQNSQNAQFTGLAEINNILGIGKRSIEIQKKQRSDIITSINKKYDQFYPDQTTLIQKQRTNFDKRSFEYYIDTSKIEFLKTFLSK